MWRHTCTTDIRISTLETYIFDLKKVSDDIKAEFHELIKEWRGLEVFGFCQNCWWTIENNAILWYFLMNALQKFISLVLFELVWYWKMSDKNTLKGDQTLFYLALTFRGIITINTWFLYVLCFSRFLDPPIKIVLRTLLKSTQVSLKITHSRGF